MKKTESNREMTVNHILYPGEKAKLRDRIAILLNKNNQEDITKLISVNKEISSDPVYSIVSPHGGWGYCDKIMASAYRSIMKKEFKTIIILGRVHREPSKALFLPNFTSYDTPLGEVNVDQSILGEISGSDKLFQYNNIPHIEEHSIEVQLPFIKYLWPAAKIVPILTGKSLKSLTRILTETLKGVLQKEAGETLIVISSGLSSYNNYETIKTETDNFISILKSPENWKNIPELLLRGDIGACSGDSISAVLNLLKTNLSIDLLDINYGDSSDSKLKRVCFGAISIKGGVL